MHDSELLILVLLVALPGLSVIARQIDVPYPILLVLGGLVLGLAARSARAGARARTSCS